MNKYIVNHKQWSDMTIFEQMGNIYSEVSRSFNARRNKNSEYETLSMIRAIDLFDATIECLIKKKSIKAKEVLRAKEQFLDNLYRNTFDEEDAASIEKYFMQFAIAVRLNR